MTDPIKSTVEYGRGLFARLEEFFLRATGKSAAGFATIETFSEVIRANANDLASRGEAAFVWLDTEVRAFQTRDGLSAFRAAKQLGGMRLVLGGSSRFLRSQLNSVSTAVLYSDTVLIPDPIMPWRSREWRDAYNHLPIHRRVLYGVSERISPLYHLFENAEELHGHPLMCLEQHAHYFKLVSHASSARLEKLGIIDPSTTALVKALGSRRLHWLGGIPSDTLAKLRIDNENVRFRERLSAAIDRLHETVLDDVGRVAAEVCHELESAIADHEKELRLVQEKYNRAHGQTAILALAAAGAALIPVLAPFLGSAAPLALGAKYGHDKVGELSEKRALTQSLVGVLATAKSGIEEKYDGA